METLSDKMQCFVRQNSKNGYCLQKAAKAGFVIQNGNKYDIIKGTWSLSRVHSMTPHTAETIDMLLRALLKYIIVYTAKSTPKQKFPFVLEAKEGYLSTPPTSCSCMHIS